MVQRLRGQQARLVEAADARGQDRVEVRADQLVYFEADFGQAAVRSCDLVVRARLTGDLEDQGGPGGQLLVLEVDDAVYVLHEVFCQQVFPAQARRVEVFFHVLQEERLQERELRVAFPVLAVQVARQPGQLRGAREEPAGLGLQRALPRDERLDALLLRLDRGEQQPRGAADLVQELQRAAQPHRSRHPLGRLRVVARHCGILALFHLEVSARRLGQVEPPDLQVHDVAEDLEPERRELLG